MLWAMGVILLHFQAVPQAVVPAVHEPAAESVQAPQAQNLMLADGSVRDAATPMEPGRLVLTPATAPGAASAAASPVPVSPGIAPARRPEFAGRMTGGQRNMWVGLAVVQHSAAAFDAWSTRRAVTRSGAQELNPMLRPFANNGSIYAATQVAPTLLDLLSRHMLTSRHPLLRHTWWVPQVLGTAASIAAGTHNLR
jgi:hypothetical protein